MGSRHNMCVWWVGRERRNQGDRDEDVRREGGGVS